MKKQIIEKIVPKNVNLFETIVEYMQKYECWIYISKGLTKRLNGEYEHKEYQCSSPKGMIFTIRSGEKWLSMYVDKEFTWDKVSSVSGYLKETSKKYESLDVADDPEYIIFLS